MKRIYILLSMAIVCIAAIAARYNYTFKDTPVAQALATLVKDNPDVKLTFIYNEMDDYKTSATVSTDNLKDAVKAIVARNPISVSEKNGRILVEALQKGKFRYAGTLVNEYQEPVAHATVLLLNPKDSVVLTYGFTSKDGSFLIPCDRNPVLAKISSTGYQTKIIHLSSTTMGTIRFNTKSIELENVNVVSDMMRMEPDRTVFMPLQRQKNTAMSGIELIEQMGIPQLIVNNGRVETLTGKSVSFFIDYLPADKDQLSGMNIQDVKRVEYLESPSDPRFMGEKFVVNFIMEKYIYGGYVKLSGYECLNMNDQEVSANVRYQYKSMTYDLAAFGQYDDIYHNGQETTEVFKFPQADGSMKTIERLSDISSSRESHAIGRLSFKATYSSTDITARSILSAGLTDRPTLDRSGEVTYTPEEYPNSSYSSKSSKKDKFIRFNGSYVFKLPKEFGLTFTPSYTFSRTDQNSSYFQDTFDPILNSADDHTNKLSGYLNLNRNFGKIGSFTAYMSGAYDYYRTRYYGSAENYDKSKDQRYKAGISYSVTAGNFYGEADFGWVWDNNRFNDFKSHSSLPAAELSLSYLLRKVHRFNAGLSYSSWAPDVSFKSQSVIEENHILSYTGNSNLTPSPHLSLDMSYSWMPSKNGYIQAFGYLWKVFDRYVYEYQPSGDKMIRYIRQPMGDYHLIDFGVSGTLYLFNRSLMLNGTLREYIARNGDPYDFTLSSLRLNLRATYWLKDFYLSGYYGSPSNYSDGFMVGDIYEDKSGYSLSAGWANKNWNVRLLAMNFARWNWASHKQWFTSEYYDRSFISYDKNRHADFSITVTYTFNYGKKLREIENLSTRDSSSSGILRN
ncbi:MAG: outer membrane beta-barrel family protein [Muribaculaceae bacterium]|nr:outer membrane beta-barrel family protein [Muribaculaceae bacterium]